MWVMMVQHKTSDQYLISGKVSTRSIHRFRRFRVLKTLHFYFYILINADADAGTVVTAIALPVLLNRRAKNGELMKNNFLDALKMVKYCSNLAINYINFFVFFLWYSLPKLRGDNIPLGGGGDGEGVTGINEQFTLPA